MAESLRLKRIAGLVGEWSGILIPDYRLPLLEAELLRLANGRGLDDLVARLEQGDAELREALLRAVSIPETYFFRHLGHYQVLRRFADARRRAGRGCRVLSAGTSTGEEAWSAAAVLATIYGEDRKTCSVTGWEADPSRLARARRGVYGNWSARQGLCGYDRSFHHRGREWSVDSGLHALVEWRCLNLVTDAFPADTRFDVVMFRNVSIYWSLAQGQLVVDKLAELLADDGLFMLGPSDPGFLDPARWARASEDGAAIFVRKAAAPGHVLGLWAQPPPSSPPRPAVAAGRRHVKTGHPSTHAHEAAKAPPPPKAPLAAGPIAGASRDTLQRAELDMVQRLADQGDYQAALLLLRQIPNPEAPPALMWQGILLMNLERAQEAAKVLQQCVFLEPEDPVYRRWLAVALEALGRSHDAAREHRNARELEGVR